MSTVPLGPFDLHAPLDRGGAGVVWRATHREQRVPAAVKVLTADTDPEVFRNEVQSVAALNHPGVVMVFDYGVVDARAAERTAGRLEEGAPWLAMELASQGSLKNLGLALSWADIRSLLVNVLDALAHAHARGVIHRDIKPGNILLGGPEDHRPGLKLADFGLARSVESTQALKDVRGTPAYMSPEQILGDWRAFGPWTDLYAVGCVAWELITGSPPYVGADFRQVAALHLSAQLPQLRPQLAIPDGLAGWLLSCLNPDPLHRFRRAADAAWALSGLGEPTDDSDLRMSTTSTLIANPTMTLDDTLMLAHTEVTERYSPTLELARSVVQPAALAIPPLPPTWRRPAPPTPPLNLLGVGLNLFGLRTVPLVDRVVARDLIWDALTDAIASEGTRIAVLHGAAGNGKSRLAQWIARRAHEVGNANVLRCVHGPTQGPMDGLGPMLARHFRTAGLDRDALLLYLPTHVHAPNTDDLPALVEFLDPQGDEQVGGLRLSRQEERWVAVERVLARLAQRRPLVLWLDDVQWGDDALGFVRWLLTRPPVGPLLVLCTAQSEALAERIPARQALSSLLKDDRAQRVDVEPLAPEDRIDLVRALLGLEGELAQQLADRTAGNPLFTVQLVGDWVSRGVLVPGRDGFQLRAGERAVLPDTLHQVWAARVDRLLAQRPEEHRIALEIAAALGQEVDAVEWSQVCTEAKIHVPVGLVDALVAARLATPAAQGWAFSHGMLRESLQRIAREAHRWAAHNQACALALSHLRQPGLDARLGQHWYQANHWSRAAELLRRGAAHRIDQANASRATGLLHLAEDALRRGMVPERDPRWGEVWLERARMFQALGQMDEGLREAQRVRARATRYGWRSLNPRACYRVGDNLRRRGHLSEARACYLEAIAGHEKRPKLNHQDLGDTLVALANTDILGGELDRARIHLARAQQLFEEIQSAAGLTRVLRFRGDIARQELRYEDSKRLFQRALVQARKTGLRTNALTATHGIAEMDRLLGNLDAAEEGYRHCIALGDAVGSDNTITALNLGLCLTARGQYEQAHAAMLPTLNAWIAARRRGYVAIAHAAMMPVAAGRSDWRGLDNHQREFTTLAALTGMVDVDAAVSAEHAGDLCIAADQRNRAIQCWEIAATTWEALNDEDRAESVLARIRAAESM